MSYGAPGWFGQISIQFLIFGPGYDPLVNGIEPRLRLYTQPLGLQESLSLSPPRPSALPHARSLSLSQKKKHRKKTLMS